MYLSPQVRSPSITFYTLIPTCTQQSPLCCPCPWVFLFFPFSLDPSTHPTPTLSTAVSLLSLSLSLSWMTLPLIFLCFGWILVTIAEILGDKSPGSEILRKKKKKKKKAAWVIWVIAFFNLVLKHFVKHGWRKKLQSNLPWQSVFIWCLLRTG